MEVLIQQTKYCWESSIGVDRERFDNVVFDCFYNTTSVSVDTVSCAFQQIPLKTQSLRIALLRPGCQRKNIDVLEELKVRMYPGDNQNITRLVIFSVKHY